MLTFDLNFVLGISYIVLFYFIYFSRAWPFRRRGGGGWYLLSILHHVLGFLFPIYCSLSLQYGWDREWELSEPLSLCECGSIIFCFFFSWWWVCSASSSILEFLFLLYLILCDVIVCFLGNWYAVHWWVYQLVYIFVSVEESLVVDIQTWCVSHAKLLCDALVLTSQEGRRSAKCC